MLLLSSSARDLCGLDAEAFPDSGADFRELTAMVRIAQLLDCDRIAQLCDCDLSGFKQVKKPWRTHVPRLMSPGCGAGLEPEQIRETERHSCRSQVETPCMLLLG